MTKRSCCKAPFVRFAVELNGSCWFCCPTLQKKCIGNIFESTFEEIWYGEKAVEFRKSVIKETYEGCDLTLCTKNFDYKTMVDLYPSYPEVIHLSYIKACNVRCVMCRDDFIYESKENTEYFNKFMDRFIDICKNAKTIYMNGGGEFFVSSHLKLLVTKILEIKPDVKFILHSNGLLFDEEHCRDFAVLGKMLGVFVSVHAASKKVYDKIVRGSNFDRVIKNLKWISSLVKKGEIPYFNMMFVVSSLNYREMVKFVKLANKLGATANFWRFRNWNTSQMCKEYDKYTVWKEDHKEYKKFLKVLRKLKGYKGFYFDDPVLQKLYDSQPESFWVKFKKRFLTKNF